MHLPPRFCCLPRGVQAARVLEFKGHGLAHLLDHYCAFKAR
jgi:hypothetical protein